ncbi:uncharacterized protein [Physcomitrium patens]|nr:non-specific lipid-transfer protein-like protein At5g64080 [Physcomitrium patens]|eukprot:XP_024393836.1 non-specific lipid-transfer protein-like protein At5g64080 [Physcomitrella patens]
MIPHKRVCGCPSPDTRRICIFAGVPSTPQEKNCFFFFLFFVWYFKPAALRGDIQIPPLHKDQFSVVTPVAPFVFLVVFVSTAVLVLFQVAMSRPGMVIPVTVLVMMMVVGVTPATTPAADCNAATASLSPCFEYVTGTGATPPKECCSGLSTLNANSPSCLCQLITQLNGSSSAASSVNITKGLSLPKDCSITLVTTNCPALANLPLSPPAGTTTTPMTGSSGPAAAPGPSSDVSRLLPSSWIMALAIAGVHALF